MIAIMISYGDFWYNKAINRTVIFEFAIGFAHKPLFMSEQ